MGKKFYIWGCVVLMIISSLILGWSYYQVVSNEGAVSCDTLYIRTDIKGRVRVSAEWLNPEEMDATNLLFNIALDTHSVNFDQFDLKNNIKVAINNQVITSGLQVEKKGAGHHVTALLKVPISNTLSYYSIRSVQLTIMNLDKVPERVLIWNL